MRGNLNQIMAEEIILEKGLTEGEEIIQEEDLTEEEVETIPEESQPTKEAVDEITRILLLNLKIRALGTVIENHQVKDSSV